MFYPKLADENGKRRLSATSVAKKSGGESSNRAGWEVWQLENWGEFGRAIMNAVR